ncbi:PREDICTED: ankyrin repeat domain-containing protein 36C, partial [Phaethon lepturus]|uniref:ankyrin repeat domain-containing protein 36C n=1 Tax=Phaethon lepturus TaxID=97097 RepID=UPI0005308AA5
TPLHLACANGHGDVVTYLVENKCKLNLLDNDNKSPLMKAVQCQQKKCVAILLEHGADPNLADADGNTALHLAVISPNTSVAELLLEHNANIDAQNKEGYSPLILAVSEHHEEMVEFLLKKGADVHARDQCERTPLMTAASGGDLNFIKVLLQYGADVSHKDTNGRTAEDYAVIHGHSSLSKQLAEYADCENTGEASAGDAQGITVLSTPHRAGAAGFMLGAPAVDRGDDGDGSRIENPKSPKKSLKERTPSDANLNKGEHGELLNQNVSDASNLEEEELEEEEEEDESDNGDDDEDYEEEEEEEEEEDLEDEETQCHDILEEEQGEKTKPRREINQNLEYFGNTKYEGEARCGTGDVCDDYHKLSKELDGKVEESVDTPVSFIAGCYERLQENITALSPKIMNNEVSCKSVPKQSVFQNLNNLQDTQESWNKKTMIQEKFHRNADSCFADSEMTNWKKETPPPLSDSCLKEKKSSFGDGFESGNNSRSAAKNPRLESQRPNSVILEHVHDDDTEEEQYEEANDKEESPEQEEEEQEKEDTGEQLRTAVVEGVKNSVCNDSHQVNNASKSA